MFRRKKSDPVEQTEAADEVQASPTPEAETDGAETDGAETAAVAGGAAVPTARAQGPWDSSEVDLEEEDPRRVDLGGLIVRGRPGFELRLQVDEASQQVAAVLLVGPEGAVELRPFAAPRNGDIWTDVRRQIAAETARRGGTATEADGPYGPELHVVMPAQTPDGQAATQPSRVLGIMGPRWLLRVTFLGRPALEPKEDGDLESAVRDVIVVRGSSPMAPGEPLPLVMPSSARPVQGQDS